MSVRAGVCIVFIECRTVVGELEIEMVRIRVRIPEVRRVAEVESGGGLGSR